MFSSIVLFVKANLFSCVFSACDPPAPIRGPSVSYVLLICCSLLFICGLSVAHLLLIWCLYAVYLLLMCHLSVQYLLPMLPICCLSVAYVPVKSTHKDHLICLSNPHNRMALCFHDYAFKLRGIFQFVFAPRQKPY